MMKTRTRIILTGLVLLLAVSLIASTVYATRYAAVQAGKNYTFYLGRSGITFFKSQFSGILKMERQNTSIIPGPTGAPKFSGNLLNVRFVDYKGDVVTAIKGPVYVSFILSGPQRNLWTTGLISIYYYQPWHNSWIKCPTYMVGTSATTITLSCSISNFGLYGVGFGSK
jgi:hypothetical protein